MGLSATDEISLEAPGADAAGLTAALAALLSKATLNAGTITSNQPFTIKQTWDQNASTFFGMRVDITDTSSLSASSPIDIRVGGSSRMQVRKDGSVWSGNSAVQIRRMLAPSGSTFGSMYGGGAGPDSPPSADTNAAWGFDALKNVTTGGNTAFGFNALKLMTTGVTCTAFGDRALAANVTGSDHTAVGKGALEKVTVGVGATAVGMLALNNDLTGNGNTGIGDSTLRYITGGDGFNTALGYSAAENAAFLTAAYCTFLGARSGRSLTGSRINNTFVGESAGLHGSQKADADNCIAIGANSFTTKNNQAVIGSASTTETVTFGVFVPGTSYTVATLPAAAAGLRGARAYVTDATSPTWLGALTGGGSVVCPVFCNGAAWVAG